MKSGWPNVFALTGFVLASGASIAFAACAASPAGTTGSGSNAATPRAAAAPEGTTVALMPVSRAGDRTRTRKTVITQETVKGVTINTRMEEVYTQETLLADDIGIPLHVRRRYERQRAQAASPDGRNAEEAGKLEGAEIELIQRDGGVTPRCISGNVPNGAMAGLLISGLDVALLPIQAVRVGERWTIDVNQRPALEGFLSGMGIKADRNELSARLIELRGDVARVPLDWKVTGKIDASGVPVALSLAGELVIDVKAGLVTAVRLAGGTRDSGGTVLKQLSFELTREPVTGWYK